MGSYIKEGTGSGGSKNDKPDISEAGASPGAVYASTRPTTQADPSSFGYKALDYLKRTHPVFGAVSALMDASKSGNGFCGHNTPTGQGMATPAAIASAAAGNYGIANPDPMTPEIQNADDLSGIGDVAGEMG